MNLTLAAGISAVLLALIHFLTDQLNLPYIPRSKWLSFAGGISVSYIFIHVLPELKEWQEVATKSEVFEQLAFLQHHLYLIALIGLTFFYGLERAAKLSYQSHKEVNAREKSRNIEIFWVHIISFCLYNFLIGYLLVHRQSANLQSLVLFFVAMAFHFLVTDYGLVSHFQETYKKKGRWMLATSVLVGFVTGALTHIREIYVGIIFGFIAGGVIMNILKEELPEERKSTYWAFLIGAVAYTTLLLSI